ncbi:hypothetical protein ACQKJZ_17885 [Sphingomonas sp. NPDC019816]|uniref:hypothetical protein n=1 Tax=unclassified Sphingomonas TaxID=196159 RepID=UPI00289D1C61|nr:hypothetical protein [Sphingomonas sp.]
MRISDAAYLAGALVLAGCSGGQNEQADDGRAAMASQKPGLAIECALGGEQGFRRDCTVEQSAAGQAVVLTLRHPDGGFRRLQVTQDGRGVAAADGALPARVSVQGDRQIEVAMGADRYRLPATVGAQ